MADENPNNPTPDLAGYPSPEALAQAYRASGAEAKRLKDRLTELEQQVSQPRQSVPQRDASGRFQATAIDRLTDYGIPVDALGEFVQAVVGNAFAPLAQGIQARGTLVGEYPDYQKFESDVAQYIETDSTVKQRYSKMFNTDPVGAMEYAFLKFGESRRRAGTPEPTPNGGPRKEASIPSMRTGSGTNPIPAESQDQAARAWDHYQKTGDPTAFAKARLRQVVSEDFYTR
jgi:hypothetical protein